MIDYWIIEIRIINIRNRHSSVNYKYFILLPIPLASQSFPVCPTFNIRLKDLRNNTYGLKKSSTAINTSSGRTGGKQVVSTCDHDRRKIKRPPSTSAQEATQVYSRATHEQTFPLQAGVSGVITVHVSFHDSGLATRPSSSSFSTSLSRVWMRKQRPRGWKYKGVHRISEFAVYLAADASGRGERETRRKGGFVHRVGGGEVRTRERKERKLSALGDCSNGCANCAVGRVPTREIIFKRPEMGGFGGWSCDDIPDRWSLLFVNREMKDCLEVNWDFIKGNNVKDERWCGTMLVIREHSRYEMNVDVRMEIEIFYNKLF